MEYRVYIEYTFQRCYQLLYHEIITIIITLLLNHSITSNGVI